MSLRGLAGPATISEVQPMDEANILNNLVDCSSKGYFYQNHPCQRLDCKSLDKILEWPETNSTAGI
uniref:Uncharacterized protein n=1 Tax=Arion vulgaris TaxID=1028688 RepID=A0A0B7B5D9_9EUPU